jgi:hypothetical protein
MLKMANLLQGTLVKSGANFCESVLQEAGFEVTVLYNTVEVQCSCKLKYVS